MNWWVHEYWQAGMRIELISQIFWVLFAITLHELAHGWAAIWQGDRTPIELGRMTANPLVQMGPQSLIVFLLCGIAWGAMPVNPHRFRNRRWGEVYVSAAGPAMNVLLALASLVLLTIWVRLGDAESDLYRNLVIFFYYGVWLNLFLAIFNLMPIPPLDGSTILSGFSRKARELYSHPQAPIIGMVVFIVVFFMSPVGMLLFRFVKGASIQLIEAAGSLVGNPTLFGTF